MKVSFLVVFSLSLLSACVTPRPNFELMSDEELYAYNSSVAPLEQVYCTKEASTGSYIRRRTCTSLAELLNTNVGTLNIPSSSTSIRYGL